jgi:hypothetical protein
MTMTRDGDFKVRIPSPENSSRNKILEAMSDGYWCGRSGSDELRTMPKPKVGHGTVWIQYPSTDVSGKANPRVRVVGGLLLMRRGWLGGALP